MKRSVLCVTLCLGLGGVAQAQTPVDPLASGNPARTIMRLQDYGVVEVALDFDPSISVLNVSYRLLNTGREAIAVFDRADLFTVDQGQQQLGEVAVPHQTFNEQGDLVIIHQSWPLPEPSPETPATNVAVLVAPGGVLNSQFRSGIWAFGSGPMRPVRRIRWCLGAMVFDEQVLDSPVQTSQGQVWRANFATVEMQHISCTAWYDVSRRAFEP